MIIKVNVSLQVDSQTALPEETALTVEASDNIQVTIPAAGVDVEVDLCPAATEVPVEMVLIRASAYATSLSYKVHASTEAAIQLRQQHLFMGQQDLLAGSGVPFDKLFFSNSGSEDVVVSVYVGRDATP